MNNQVFVNRTLNMKKIKAIGFDMDYTLVRYNIHNFEKDTHQMLIQKLIDNNGYPQEIKKLLFEPHRIIRGLVIDTKKGKFFKTLSLPAL